MRAIRLFIKDGEGTKGKGSAGQERRQGRAAAGEEKKTTYQLTGQASPRIREEDFAKQLRLARYLAGASLQQARPLDSGLKTRALSRSDPLEGRGLKSRRKRESKRLGRRNWQRKGGGLGG